MHVYLFTYLPEFVARSYVVQCCWNMLGVQNLGGSGASSVAFTR